MKPILFNTEMVRAILDGRKTITRRIAKGKILNSFVDVGFSDEAIKDIDNHLIDECQYKVGDVMYVRETFYRTYYHEYGKTFYRADGEKIEMPLITGATESVKPKWSPSLHMPKKYARIFIKVTDVRVERLQDISEEQAKAEGVEMVTTPNVAGVGKTYIQGFGELWDSTIKKVDLERYGWEVNPWVWVIEFERCGKPESEV